MPHSGESHGANLESTVSAFKNKEPAICIQKQEAGQPGVRNWGARTRLRVLGSASGYSVNIASVFFAATWVKGTGGWGQTVLRVVGLDTPEAPPNSHPWHSKALRG